LDKLFIVVSGEANKKAQISESTDGAGSYVLEMVCGYLIE
jgi:hypothetical protein